MAKVKVVVKVTGQGTWSTFEEKLQNAYSEGYRITHIQLVDARCVAILENEDD